MRYNLIQTMIEFLNKNNNDLNITHYNSMYQKFRCSKSEFKTAKFVVEYEHIQNKTNQPRPKDEICDEVVVLVEPRPKVKRQKTGKKKLESNVTVLERKYVKRKQSFRYNK